MSSPVRKFTSPNLFILFKKPLSCLYIDRVFSSNVNNFRPYDSTRLEADALSIIQDCRATMIDPKRDKILVPNVKNLWGTNNALNKDKITLKISGMKEKRYGRDSDEECMRKFLKQCESGSIIDPGLCRYYDLLPAGAPLIDFLRIDYKRPDTWKVPAVTLVDDWRMRRSFSSVYPDDIDVREFIVGTSTEQEFEEFINFVSTRIEKDESENPIGVLSFDVESLRITKFDKIRMTRPEMKGKTFTLGRRNKYTDDEERWFEDENGTLLEDGYTNFPAKVMMGDGIHWAALISFTINKSSKGYDYTCNPVLRSMVNFLNKLPVVQGLGISEDVRATQDWFSLLSGESVKLAGFVDIANLAILAGYQLSSFNMTAVSLNVNGSTLNKIVSVGDGKWGLRFDLLPRSLRAYAIADLKFGHMAYSTLMTILLREIFPDPDVSCRLTGTNQFLFVEWFSSWIRSVLVGVRIDTAQLGDFPTRESLFDALRYRDSGSKLSLHAPSRVDTVRCITNCFFPTITRGGARFLQPVRNFFLAQYESLRQSGIEPRMFGAELTQEDKWYARFGHTDFSRVNLAAPVPVNARLYPLALVTPREMVKDVMSPDPLRNLTGSVLMGAAGEVDRDMRAALLEWCRLDIHRIAVIFDRMGDDEFFSMRFRGYYEDFRLMYLNTRCFLMDLPEPMESENRKGLDRRIEEEKAKYEEMLDVLARQKYLVESLEAYKDVPEWQNREKWRELDSVSLIKKKVVFIRPGFTRREVRVPPPVQPKGRPRSIQLFEHRAEINIDQEINQRRPWMSDTDSSRMMSGRSWDIPLVPVQPEADEHHLQALAPGKGKKRVASSTVTSSSSKRMTQDEIEERRVNHYEDDNMI